MMASPLVFCQWVFVFAGGCQRSTYSPILAEPERLVGLHTPHLPRALQGVRCKVNNYLMVINMIILWMLIGIIAFFFLASLLYVIFSSTFAFWMAPRFLFARKPETQRYAGQKPPRGLFTVMLREVVSSFLVLMMFLTIPFVRGANRGRGGTPLRPILLVKGYGLTASSWFYFIIMLLRRGVSNPIYVFGYNWLDCVEKSAGELTRFVETVLTREGASEVDIVAHSWGGVVSRWYIEQFARAGTVRRLVMLATPNCGSWSTFYAIGCPAVQLAVGSPVINSLQKAPPGTRYYLLWSRFDQVAAPPQLALLPGHEGTLGPLAGAPETSHKIEVNQEVNRIGHLTALVSGKVVDLVLHRLTYEESDSR
ncbi:MAG: lipase [Bryobacterales bacterium]|nr:lipase [Bryobacterales bacterium]